MKRYRVSNRPIGLHIDLEHVSSPSAVPADKVNYNEYFIVLESHGRYMHLILSADKTGWAYITPMQLWLWEITEP